MAWTPISGTMTQYQTSTGALASSYYLKFYQSGTTTAFNMATDSTGGTTIDKAQLDSSGYPTTDGSTRFIPHVNQKYKIALYKNSTDADADTIANADWNIDAIDQVQVDTTDAWVLFSGTPTQTAATTFTLTGDQTSTFTAGTRIKADDSSTLYGIVIASAFTTVTTVTVTLDSGSLSGSLSAVYTGLSTTVGQEVSAHTVSYNPVETSSVNRDLKSKLGDRIDVKDYGAAGDGTTDDTAAIQAAIDALGTTAGTVYFPTGTYLVTSTIRVKYDRQHLLGAGMYSTEIRFTPTANDVCFHFEKYSGAPSSVLIQGSIKDMAFYSTDSTYEKTAIDLIDTGGYAVENIVVGGSVAVGSTGLWSNGVNGASIGVKTNGREAGVFNYLYIAADIPINLADNPNSTLDVDHFHFSNLYLLGGNGATLTNPLFKIDDGVNVQNLTLDGFQAWVGGGAGFYYVDTTTAQSSQQITIRNIRHESATNASNHMIRIEHNSAVNQLIIDNCFGAQSQLGIKLREINAASLSNCLMLCTTGSALDVDSTVSPLKLDNFSRQSGSTVDVGTLVKVFDSGIFAQGGPSFAYYQDPAVITTIVVDTPLSGTKQTVANDGTISIGAAATTRGMLIVDTSDNVGCMYYLAGAGDNTIEVSVSNVGFFSATQGSASKYNIYYDAGGDDYKIENKRGGNRDIRFLLIGGVN